MNARQKEQWLQALRSGRFEQAQQALVITENKQPIGYCCLGVAACIFELERDKQHPDEFVDSGFLSLDTQRFLATLNDGGWDVQGSRHEGWTGNADFAGIADYIERYVEAE